MLQGSLDNFSLDEVLGLLASTAKTGSLEVKGDRGIGTLGLQNGQLVAASASNTANGIGIEDVVFEMLRFTDGNFMFSPGTVDAQGPGRLVPDVIAAAENRLADWRLIEAVVPSLSHTVSPVPALPADEITVDRREWSTLIVIGHGCPVSAVCSELDLGEVEGSRQIKDLAERGLVSIGPPAKVGNGNGFPGAADAGQPADPFARRTDSPPPWADSPLPPPAAADRLNPLAPSARDLVGAGVGAGNGNGNGNGNGTGGNPLRPSRSMTAPGADLGHPDRPGVAEGDHPGQQGPASPPAVPSEGSRPSGLLMRYLKGED